MIDHAAHLHSRPPNAPASLLAGFVFFGFVMVVLSVLIDPHAIDVTMIPRLLFLLVFLFLFVALLLFLPAAALAPAGLWREPLILAFTLYAGLTNASLFFATNVSAGWTDVFRTWASLFVLVLTCVLLPAIPSWPQFLAKVGTVAGLLAGLVGYHEMATELGMGLHPRPELLAITGLMSNVNLFASYLALVLPLCLYGGVILRGGWRLAALAASVATLSLIVLLQTRSAYLGLAVGFASTATIVYIARYQLGLGARLRPVLLGTAAVITILLVAFVAVADSNEIVQRIRSIFAWEPTSAAGGRIVIWQVTLQMAADHWLTGIGAGNFPVLLHDYFDIDNPDFSSIHPNWLQPHNDFLWVLAEKGLFGFGAFLSIFFCAAIALRRALSGSLASEYAWIAVFTAMALSSYFVISCFDFPQERVNHQVYLSIYLGVAVILSRAVGGESYRPGNNNSLVQRGLLIAALCVFIAGILYSYAALRQEWYTLKARANLADGDYKALVRNAQLASTPWKSLDHFATPVAFLEGLGLMFLAKHDAALERFEVAREQLPSRNYITKHLGLLASLTKDYPRAIEAFSAVLLRSPDDQDTKRRLAECLFATGDIAGAEALVVSVPEDQASEETRHLAAKIAAQKSAAPLSGDRTQGALQTTGTR